VPGDLVARREPGLRTRNGPGAPQDKAQKAAVEAGRAETAGGPESASAPRGSLALGLGRLKSWELCRAQASTTYHRPLPSRSQPDVTVGSGQLSGLPPGSYTKRWQRPRSADQAPA
jgi:hypothetical protein